MKYRYSIAGICLPLVLAWAGNWIFTSLCLGIPPARHVYLLAFLRPDFALMPSGPYLPKTIVLVARREDRGEDQKDRY